MDRIKGTGQPAKAAVAGEQPEAGSSGDLARGTDIQTRKRRSSVGGGNLSSSDGSGLGRTPSPSTTSTPPSKVRRTSSNDAASSQQTAGTADGIARQEPHHPSLSLRALFETQPFAAKQIVDFGLHLGIKQAADTTGLSNQELMQTVGDLYQDALGTSGRDDANVLPYLEEMRRVSARLEDIDRSTRHPREKLTESLSIANAALDPVVYRLPGERRDMLATDGNLSRPLTEQQKESITAKAKLALAFALKQFSMVDWNEAPRSMGNGLNSQVETLENIVSLKTILNHSNDLLNTDVPALLNIANGIHAPSQAERDALEAQFAQNMQQFFQDFMLNPRQQLQRLQQLPRLPRLPERRHASISDFETKMRCYTAAAGALTKFGNSEQKQEALDLTAKVKTLFDDSKELLYNNNQQDPLQAAMPHHFARQAEENARRHEAVLSKALFVEILAGGADSALSYCNQVFDSVTKRNDLLLNLLRVAKDNIAFSTPERRANLFKQPLAQVTADIVNHDTMRQLSKCTALKDNAVAFSQMGLHKEADETFDRCFDFLSEQNNNNPDVFDATAGVNGREFASRLLETLLDQGQHAKIRPMIDRQPAALRPELLARACESLHYSSLTGPVRNAPPSETVRSYWADAKSIAMNLSRLPDKVHALLMLSDDRYARFQEPNEAESIIQSVRGMNDGSETFREAYRRFEYRVGPL